MGTLSFNARSLRNGSEYSTEGYGGSSAVRRTGGDGTNGWVMEIKLVFPVAISEFSIYFVPQDSTSSSNFRYSIQSKQNSAYYNLGTDDQIAAVSYDGSFRFPSNDSAYTLKVSKAFEAKTYYMYLFSSQNKWNGTHTQIKVASSKVNYTEAPKPALPGFVNVNGTFYEIEDGFANVNGTWHKLVELYGNNGGEWIDMDAMSDVVVVQTTTQTINVNNTHRYCSVATNKDWPKVSTMGLGAVNYVGEGADDYNSMMIPLSAWSFSGTAKSLELTMSIYVADSSNRTFRWAITTSTANKTKYQGYGDISDSYQLAAGKFTPTYYSDKNWHVQTFTLECKTIPANTPLYIYLWRDNNKYGNIHVRENLTITLNYN